MYKQTRQDTKYCSPACRQKAHRVREDNAGTDLDREIERARLHFWSLVYQKAIATGTTRSEVLTYVANYIDIDGNVFEGFPGGEGRWVGKVGPKGMPSDGWETWGLEAAPPPWRPPPIEPMPMPKRKSKKRNRS